MKGIVVQSIHEKVMNLSAKLFTGEPVVIAGNTYHSHDELVKAVDVEKQFELACVNKALAKNATKEIAHTYFDMMDINDAPFAVAWQQYLTIVTQGKAVYDHNSESYKRFIRSADLFIDEWDEKMFEIMVCHQVRCMIDAK